MATESSYEESYSYSYSTDDPYKNEPNVTIEDVNNEGNEQPEYGNEPQDQTESYEQAAVAAAPSGDLAADGLNQHNTYRAEQGVPALQWDDNLAAQAQQYAEELANSGRFGHSGVEGQGENLYKGSASYSQNGSHFAYATYDWVKGGNPSEEQDYFAGGSNNGHYTQVMWRNTTHLGMGYAAVGDQVVVVGRYMPQGNWNGEAPY